MSAAEIDNYLQHLDEPKRSTLSQLRRDILAVAPGAGQCISYGGSLRFPVDQPLPPELVEKLITVRLRQAFPQRP